MTTSAADIASSSTERVIEGAAHGQVNALAVVTLPDGRVVLASGGDDATVRLWDPLAGQALATLRGHAGRVLAVAAVPILDGVTLLASAGADHTVRLWDPETGTAVGPPLLGHTDWVRALVAVPTVGGRTVLASAGDDGTVRYWDPRTSGPVGKPFSHRGRPVFALATVLLGDDHVVASGDGGGTIRFSHPSRTLRVVPIEAGQVNALATLRDEAGRPRLVSAGDDGSLRVWSVDTGEEVGRPLRGHGRPVNALVALPGQDRSVVASAGNDGMVRLWDVDLGLPVGSPLTGHAGRVRGLAVVPGSGDSLRLMSAGADGAVRSWMIDPSGSLQADGPEMVGHTSPVLALSAFTDRDRPVLASGGGDGTIRFFDAESDLEVGPPLGAHVGPVLALAVQTGMDGSIVLASAGDDGSIRRWDVRARESRGEPLAGHLGPIRALAVVERGGGSVLASAGTDGTVRLWDPLTDEAQILTGHDGAVLALVAIAGSGGRALLASSGADHTVRLWDPMTGRQVELLTGHTAEVVALTVVDIGPTLVSADAAGWIREWAVADGTPAAEPVRDHEGAVLALGTLGSGGPALVAAGDDGVVRVRAAGAVGPATVHRGAARAVTTVEVGDRLLVVSGGDDGAIRISGRADDRGPPDEVPSAPRTEALGVQDSVDGPDALGREVLAAHLQGLLAQLVRGSETGPTGGSAVVHVDGRWGSGKSTLIALLRRRLATPSDSDPRTDDPIVIEYNAWRESSIAPEWWSLATALNRGVRQERAGATRVVMTVGGTLARVVRSPPLLLAIGVLVAALALRASGVLTNAKIVSEGLAALAALAALGLAAGRVLFWASPTFGRLSSRADDNPLGEIAAVIGRLRRWSPRARRRHRLADTLLAVWIAAVVLTITAAFVADPVARGAALVSLGWWGDAWPAVAVGLAVALVVASGPERFRGERRAPVEPTALVVRRGRTASRGVVVAAAVVAAGVAAALLVVFGVPTGVAAAVASRPEAITLGVLVAGIAAHACWTRTGLGIPKRPIMLVVDDLDRCSAERTVKLLETIHTVLLDAAAPRALARWRAPATIVVLVLADGRWVRSAFESVYATFAGLSSPVHGLGADFLQKIFDHTVLVPSLSGDQVGEFLDHVTGGARSDVTLPARPAGVRAEALAPVPHEDRADDARAEALAVVEETDKGELGSETVIEAVADPALRVADAVEVEARRAEREAGTEATAVRADHLLAGYAAVMPANPRLVKRVANTWGMLRAVQGHLHPGRPASAPSDDLLARAAILYVQYPSLVDDLLSAPDLPSLEPPDEPAEDATPSPWHRSDVLRLLRVDGEPVPMAEIARCFAREY